MEYRQLTENLAVGPQIEAADIAALAERGVKTLICNRPDGEEAGQPGWESIRAAAEAAGMNTVFLPVDASTMGPQIARQFAETVGGSDGPVYAYCRTGTRCTTLWSLAQLMQGTDPAAVVNQAAAAGYDMSGLAANFANR